MDKVETSSIVRVDARGYVYVGDVKVCRYVAHSRTLQFCDKDKARSELRGSRYVEVPLAHLLALSGLVDDG